MILAGDQIDLTLGEKLGWSTLAAAGFGNTLSDIVGLWLGDHIEAMAARLGVQAPALTQAQAQLPITRRTKLAANVVGLTVGCLIGMLPLLVLQDRKQVYFDADALALYETVFAPYGVSPTQFFELMHLCRWRTHEAGHKLVESGEELDRVMLLHSGVAQAWETDARGSRRLMYLYAGRCGSAAPEEDTLEPVVVVVEPEPLPRSPTLAPLSRRDSGSEVELRSIIGGSALIDRELLGRPYPNEVVLARRSIYVEWPAAELLQAMDSNKAVEAAVLNILYRELARKVRSQRDIDRGDGVISEYRMVLSVVLADGIIHPAEKMLVREYALKKSISAEAHEAILKELDWTIDEWDQGVKRQVWQLPASKPSHRR